MRNYYTRACNFYHGAKARNLIKKKLALSLCGNKNLAFDYIEILSRKAKNRLIHIKKINLLEKTLKKIVQNDIKKITNKRSNLNKDLRLSEPLIMGILNLTPDSFSDGGLFNRSNKAFSHIKNMINKGANIIDVGGESTRPGSKNIPPNIEWKRIEKIITKFKKKYPKIFLSVDTRKSEVMLQAIKNKSDLINDVSAFNYDIHAIDKIKKFNVWKVLHHMQGTPNTMQIKPKYENVLLDLYDFFEEKLKIDFKKFKHKKFIIDPGIGFGKNLKHNISLMSNISIFHTLGFPILVGNSRKKFIKELSGKNDTSERIGGTVASSIYLMSQGVQILRVHDINELLQGLKVFKELIKN